MTKTRIFLFLITVVVISTLASLVFLYARGYRYNSKDLKFSPNGLLVIKSDPDGAQVYINGELKTATNATMPLIPDDYDIVVRKEGYFDWGKRIKIQKEEVTELTAGLFKSTPSLSPITFSGAQNPLPSTDLTKISYLVPYAAEKNGTDDKSGLWLIENFNLPLGFSREPRRITDGDLSNSSWIWSADSREILLKTTKGTYLLNTGSYTPQSQRVNVKSQEEEILLKWKKESDEKLSAKLKHLPEDLASILTRKSKSIVFSPDEDMVLYTASGSAEIPENLIKPVPGASTQKQDRSIKNDHTYVYDIKEDRNFLIDETSSNLILGGNPLNEEDRRLLWFPTSRHLILAETDRVVIMDYDGTNSQSVYSGVYTSPHVYPTVSFNRLLLLTNLGANSSLPNLYSLLIK